MIGDALVDQMRTDELRDLLERHPMLDRSELQRLRELYATASATEVMAILASPDLARKAARLNAPEGITAGRLLMVGSLASALLAIAYLAMPAS
jgi:hypothetical protein